MWSRILIALAVAISIALTAAQTLAAVAQPATVPCTKRSLLIKDLQSEFGEVIVGRGLRSDGALIEVFAGPRQSWTVVITFASGISCLIAEGEAWEPVPVQTGPET